MVEYFGATPRAKNGIKPQRTVDPFHDLRSHPNDRYGLGWSDVVARLEPLPAANDRELPLDVALSRTHVSTTHREDVQRRI